MAGNIDFRITESKLTSLPMMCQDPASHRGMSTLKVFVPDYRTVVSEMTGIVKK